MLNIWRISWRNMTTHKKRFFFSLIAIIFGISFLTAMLIADRTTNDVFRYYEKMYVANADYWILSDEHTYSEAEISSVITSPEVTNSLLALDKQAFFELNENRTLQERSVRITGVSDQASSLLKLPVIEGSLDNKGFVIPKAVAELLDKKVGDTIAIEGLGTAKVSAIVEYTQLLASPDNWENANSTSFRIMAPLDMLREWTGMNNEISYMRFQTEGDGKELFQSVQQTLKDTSMYIQPVVADDLQSNDIEGLYAFFYLVAILSICISGFIVFNIIYTSVMERKKEFAVMKSLGYLQSSVSKLVLIEMTLLASVGTLIGVPFGVWLGDIFMEALLSVFKFDMVYTLQWELPVIISGLIGLLFPVIFALFPIYVAGKTPVLLAIKEASTNQSASYRFLIRNILGLGMLGFLFMDGPLSYIAILVASVLLFPCFVIGLKWVLKPVLEFLFYFPGKVAAKNLIQQLNRNANSAAILAIGIAIILLLGAAIESAPKTLGKEIRETYGGDVRITSEAPWTQGDIAKLQSYEFVTKVEPLAETKPITWKTTQGNSRQFSVFSVNRNGPSLFDAEKNVYSKLAHKPTVILGSRAFEEWGGNIGQTIEMNTPSGKQRYEVIDVVNTSHYSGYVAFMDNNHFQENFGWSSAFDILLTVDKQTEQLRTELYNDFGDHLAKVQTVEEEIESATSAVKGMNDLILFMLLLIILLASVGTANTLLMNTMERRVEIGTMRAIGFTKQQVRTMVLLEGLLIGLAGVFGGIIIGALLIYVTSKWTFMEGFMSFQLPLDNVILAMIAGVTLSLCAAWVSSRSVMRQNVASSLKEG
ncbi:permease [Virgibacillus pantothenticus]|uniref:Peptide ABC transporter permease n=1 Tax=Virgibacillus pantothenticus TaxID=1473 RepID=A0A0L0QVX8_VIRPA|nr:ABC transporter permease [Virgibacillus pantothenticus]KNE22363.1 peptide ABC transporter permease [Virgibacillus pantothenticus]MBU8567806.1 ABC transporter permease [Virgibacillus pantothenticus]MBU8601599.1 ABC transporter permease [Virgibacillus pantothenticus]MBU8635828.1 ABC transporter permease [Virgibacillus pantothenticus]MBU8643534.1 ABC transporter permease [Virgibacillus pantothenticus]